MEAYQFVSLVVIKGGIVGSTRFCSFLLDIFHKQVKTFEFIESKHPTLKSWTAQIQDFELRWQMQSSIFLVYKFLLRKNRIYIISNAEENGVIFKEHQIKSKV